MVQSISSAVTPCSSPFPTIEASLQWLWPLVWLLGFTCLALLVCFASLARKRFNQIDPSSEMSPCQSQFSFASGRMFVAQPAQERYMCSLSLSLSTSPLDASLDHPHSHTPLPLTFSPLTFSPPPPPPTSLAKLGSARDLDVWA